MWTVQTALHGDSNSAFETLDEEGIKLLTGSEGPEPLDTSGFPRWWLDVPADIQGNAPEHPAFNLSAWIIEQSKEAAKQAIDVHAEVFITDYAIYHHLTNIVCRMSTSSLSQSY